MRWITSTAVTCFGFAAFAQTSAVPLWKELAAKREALASVHQEFEVEHTTKTSSANQSSKLQVILDMAQGKWRERSVMGSGNRIRIFDGTELYSMEEGGDEFVRVQHRSKDEDPVPAPYGSGDLDWEKALELQRLSCGIPGIDHTCVVLEVPLKKWIHLTSASQNTKMLNGTARLFLDTESGLLVALRTLELIEGTRGQYESRSSYTLKRMSYGKPADASLFQRPSGLREVKELARWNAAKIKKQLAGKPAPELAVTDIQGKPLALSAFKGKTVLLDFWTTWCPPCRADGPALEKLYAKYGGEDLMIVGISVNEDRALVEKFLKDHPHRYPIVLTSENEMPRPYQIGIFPTYVVVERDGTVSTAVDGDRGFSDLRKLLKKAGLEVE